MVPLAYARTLCLPYVAVNVLLPLRLLGAQGAAVHRRDNLVHSSSLVALIVLACEGSQTVRAVSCDGGGRGLDGVIVGHKEDHESGVVSAAEGVAVSHRATWVALGVFHGLSGWGEWWGAGVARDVAFPEGTTLMLSCAMCVVGAGNWPGFQGWHC
jgi:hypothetical protein